MSLRINTNIPALMALRNLNSTETEMSGTITRLSTGLRINSGADDPAGLIISEGMRSQIKGVGQAIRNSQDAVNMTKTAEGALDELQRLLRDIRALAVHSANSAVVDSNTLQANQTQIRSTLQSINRIAEQTQFGNKKLLDGTAGAVANITASNLASSVFMGGNFNGEPVVSGAITIAQTTAAERAQVSLGNTFADGSAIVTATGTFVINGYSFSSNGTESVDTLIEKINSVSQTTGVSASLTGTSPNMSIDLKSNDFGSRKSINFFDPSNILHSSGSASDSGVDGVYNVTVMTANGAQTAVFQGGRAATDSGLRLTDAYGNSIMLSEYGNSTITTAVELGQITAGNVRFQIGGNSDQSVAYAMPVVYANRLGTSAVAGKSLADLDVTSSQGAQEAMRIIDDAISQMALMRGELGSFQANFLESTVRSLNVANENLTSSESQIRDADMAHEMTQFTRLQILKQSGMAVLAQASQAPQSVLQLLQNG